MKEINDIHTLILNATKNLNNATRQLIQDRLKSLSNTNEWFRSYLIRALINKLTFANRETETIARYHVVSNVIHVNPKYFDAKLPKSVLIASIDILLRHEVTHVIDFMDKKGSQSELNMLIQRLSSYSKLMNSLFNQLNCIEHKKSVNRETLTKLSQMCSNSMYTFGDTSKSKYTLQELTKINNISISNIGSIFDISKIANRDIVTRNIINFWPIGNDTYITRDTYDLQNIRELFVSTLPTRTKNDLTSLENIYLTYFNNNDVKIWSSLSQAQKEALNILYLIRTRVLANIAADEHCFPKLRECLSAKQADCLNSFLQCQNSLPVKDLSVVSYFEIRAVLQERCDGGQITEDLINSLCPNQKTNTPPPQINSSETKLNFISQLNSSLTPALYPAGYSFCEDISRTYFEHNKYNRILLLCLLIKLTYVSFIGAINYARSNDDNISLMWQIYVPMLLVLITSFLTEALKASKSSKLNTMFQYGLTATVCTADSIVNGPQQAIASFGTNIVACSIGSLLAKTMAKGLGWHTAKEQAHQQLCQRINPILQTEKQAFKPFSDAINNMQYSKALRIACTSTDAKAFALIKILLSYKKILQIDINEAAGTQKLAAIHYAAKKGNAELYHHLKEQGANADKLDGDNKSAKDYLLEYLQKNNKISYQANP